MIVVIVLRITYSVLFSSINWKLKLSKSKNSRRRKSLDVKYIGFYEINEL